MTLGIYKVLSPQGLVNSGKLAIVVIPTVLIDSELLADIIPTALSFINQD